MIRLVQSILGIDLAGHDLECRHNIRHKFNEIKPTIYRYYECKVCGLNFAIIMQYKNKEPVRIDYLGFSIMRGENNLYICNEIDYYNNFRSSYRGGIKSCNEVIMDSACL